MSRETAHHGRCQIVLEGTLHLSPLRPFVAAPDRNGEPERGEKRDRRRGDGEEADAGDEGNETGEKPERKSGDGDGRERRRTGEAGRGGEAEGGSDRKHHETHGRRRHADPFAFEKLGQRPGVDLDPGDGRRTRQA